MRHKHPATRNIGIDADPRAIAAWTTEDSIGIELVCARAEDFLSQYEFSGDELVYADPPYYPCTRRRARVYRRDYSPDDHAKLLSILTSLPCMVVLSGYANSLYADVLGTWRIHTFRSKTHNGVREETLWFNFEVPQILHDSRYLGPDFRARQATKRRLLRLQDKVQRMPAVERAAFSRWLHTAYPSEPRSHKL